MSVRPPAPGSPAVHAASVPASVTGAKLRCVIFDLDGVLIDSWRLMQHALAEAVRQCGGGDPPVEAFRRQLGRPLPRIAEALGMPAAFVDAYVDSSRRNAALAAPFQGVEPGLRRLRRRGLTLSLSTGKDRPRTLEVLDRFGLRSLFSCIVTGDDVDHGKPHPEALDRVLDAEGLTAQEAVFVGDAPVDVACAAAAGVPLLAVSWGIASPDELRHAGAERIAADVAELFDWIQHMHEETAV